MKVWLGDKEFIYDDEKSVLIKGKNEIALKPKENQVLKFLIQSEETQPNNKILLEVWKTKHKSIDVVKGVVKDLRKKLEDPAHGSKYIRTIKGEDSGYKFIANVSEVGEDSNNRLFNKNMDLMYAFASLVLIVCAIFIGDEHAPGSSRDAEKEVFIEAINIPYRWYSDINQSNDGVYFALLGNEVGQPAQNLYVHKNAANAAMVYYADNVVSSVFDHESTSIYYVVIDDTGCSIHRHFLAEVRTTLIAKCSGKDNDVSIDLSNDGMHLFVAENDRSELPRSLYQYDVSTGIRKLIIDTDSSGAGIYRVFTIPGQNQIITFETMSWMNGIIRKHDLINHSSEHIAAFDLLLLDAAVFSDRIVVKGQGNRLISYLFDTKQASEILGIQSQPIYSPSRGLDDSINYISGEPVNIEIVNAMTGEKLTRNHVDYYPVMLDNTLYFGSRRGGTDQIWKISNNILTLTVANEEKSPIMSFDVVRHRDNEIIATSYTNGIAISVNSSVINTECSNQSDGVHGQLNASGEKLLYGIKRGDIYQIFECNLKTGETIKVSERASTLAFYDTGDVVYLVDYVRSELVKKTQDAETVIASDIKIGHPHHVQILDEKLFYSKEHSPFIYSIDLITFEKFKTDTQINPSFTFDDQNHVITTVLTNVNTIPMSLKIR